MKTTDIMMYLDSSITVSLMQGETLPTKNLQLVRTLQTTWETVQTKHPQITASWVQGHSGTQGNQVADYGTNLAQMGITGVEKTDFETLTVKQLNALRVKPNRDQKRVEQGDPQPMSEWRY